MTSSNEDMIWLVCCPCLPGTNLLSVQMKAAKKEVAFEIGLLTKGIWALSMLLSTGQLCSRDSALSVWNSQIIIKPSLAGPNESFLSQFQAKVIFAPNNGAVLPTTGPIGRYCNCGSNGESLRIHLQHE